MKLQTILLLTGIAAGLTTVSCKSLDDEVQEFYGILQNLYRQKIRLPLFSLAFWDPESAPDIHRTVAEAAGGE